MDRTDSARSLLIGTVFPTSEIGNNIADIREFAVTAEGLGFQFLSAPDHILGAAHDNRAVPLTGPYSDSTPFHEVFVLFGFLAAITTNIKLVTGICVLPQRPAALVAKQAAELEILSESRFVLGVGSGWNHIEMEGLGQKFSDRGVRFTEQIELIRRLWTEPLIDFTGRSHRIDRAAIMPRPSTSIPIWFGGYSNAAVERAGRLGDGFLFTQVSSLSIRAAERLRELATANGRDPDTFSLATYVRYSPDSDQWLAELDRWSLAGGTHALIDARRMELSTRDHIDVLHSIQRLAHAFMK